MARTTRATAGRTTSLVRLAVCVVALLLDARVVEAQLPLPAATNPLGRPIPGDSMPRYVRRNAPDDPVVQRIWEEGTLRSHAMRYAQVLSDSIGPRLTGSPSIERGQEWLMREYDRIGVPARRERYGSWAGWDRGATHLDLTQPRVRALQAIQLSWSPGTEQRMVEGPSMTLPDVADTAAFGKWLGSIRDRFILVSAPEMSCRSTQQWDEFATPAERSALRRQQDSVRAVWTTRRKMAGDSLLVRLARAGAAAALSSNWSGLPGVDKIFGSPGLPLPVLDVACEDYGLLSRLTERHQGPRLRMMAAARSMGERDVFNVIAELRGDTKPEEFVILSAHFDSWEGGSGATDNGTGTVMMLEAMRILRAVFPHPTRTILVGHWTGEEQAFNGSRAFTEDHPDIVDHLQALFNQDNGTGRVLFMGPGALADADSSLARYLAAMPADLTQWIRLSGPGLPSSGGSDHSSFVCSGAPAFALFGLGWNYSALTWHTNLDTFDKIVPEELQSNAILAAMLAYMASEDPRPMPRRRLDLTTFAPDPVTHEHPTWPVCQAAPRTSPLMRSDP